MNLHDVVPPIPPDIQLALEWIQTGWPGNTYTYTNNRIEYKPTRYNRSQPTIVEGDELQRWCEDARAWHAAGRQRLFP